jgi:hypothetical protein
LDLHYAVGLLWVLVLDDVVFELGVRHVGRFGRVGESGARVFGEELVANFGEKLVGYEGGVFVVGDHKAAHAFGTAVGVECVIWTRSISICLRMKRLR